MVGERAGAPECDPEVAPRGEAAAAAEAAGIGRDRVIRRAGGDDPRHRIAHVDCHVRRREAEVGDHDTGIARVGRRQQQRKRDEGDAEGQACTVPRPAASGAGPANVSNWCSHGHAGVLTGSETGRIPSQARRCARHRHIRARIAARIAAHIAAHIAARIARPARGGVRQGRNVPLEGIEPDRSARGRPKVASRPQPDRNLRPAALAYALYRGSHGNERIGGIRTRSARRAGLSLRAARCPSPRAGSSSSSASSTKSRAWRRRPGPGRSSWRSSSTARAMPCTPTSPRSTCSIGTERA